METATRTADVLAMPQQLDAASAPVTVRELILNDKSVQQLMAVAELMANSKATIPVHLKGNVGDCFAVAMQALQWGMNPFAVAQKTHVVSGTLGYEAQLVNAAVNTMAPTKDRLHFEWFGPWENVIGKFEEKTNAKGDKYRKLSSTIKDELGCGVKTWATLKGENEPRELSLLLTQARVRNSTLWADDPKQQLAYLAIKRWSRLYCPDVILGVYTPDELQEPRDMGDAEVVTENTKREEKPAAYAQAKFDENLPAWTEKIGSGKTTADRMIAFINSRANPLTAEQEKALRAIKRKPATGESKDSASDAEVLATAEQIAQVRLAAEDATLSERDICTKFNLEKLEPLRADLLEPIMAFIANPMEE